MDYLIECIWDELDLVKVYTKKRGAHPDLEDPICLRKGATVEVCCVSALRFRDLKWAYLMACQGVCNGIHRSLAANFRYALVW